MRYFSDHLVAAAATLSWPYLLLIPGAALVILHRHSRELLVGVSLAMTFIVSLILLPDKHAADLKTCDHNLKTLSTALEMYSTDNLGRYPVSLEPLCPNYLSTIPLCPAARKDSYAYVVVSIPDAYTVVCAGSFHSPDFPYHSSNQHGLLLP